MSATVKKKRIFYLDALRALAILSVIIIHVFMYTRMNVAGEYGVIPTMEWFFYDFLILDFRIGVVLFLMLSGSLSLGREWSLRSFLGKRLPRIIEPFLFWGFFLSLLMIFVAYTGHVKWIESFDVMSILNYIYHAYLANSKGFYQYWFFWMILGTYLIMPIFNKWVYHSDLREIEYFLVFWLITCIFDFTLFISFPIKLTYFVSPIGLVVLGYYLRYTDRKLLNNPYFAIFLIIISTIVMMYISYKNSSVDGFYTFNRYCIYIAIEVTGIWMLFRNFNKLRFKPRFITNPNGIFRKFCSTLAKYSYGIYLTHVAFLSITWFLIRKWPNFHLAVFVLFMVTVFVPLGLLAILNRVPYVNQVIGAK